MMVVCVVMAVVMAVCVVVCVCVAVRVIMAVPVIMIVRMGVAIMRVAVRVVLIVNMLHARRYRDRRLGLRVELLAEQQHQRGAAEREQRYQPDVVEKVHVTT